MFLFVRRTVFNVKFRLPKCNVPDAPLEGQEVRETHIFFFATDTVLFLKCNMKQNHMTEVILYRLHYFVETSIGTICQAQCEKSSNRK